MIKHRKGGGASSTSTRFNAPPPLVREQRDTSEISNEMEEQESLETAARDSSAEGERTRKMDLS